MNINGYFSRTVNTCQTRRLIDGVLQCKYMQVWEWCCQCAPPSFNIVNRAFCVSGTGHSLAAINSAIAFTSASSALMSGMRFTVPYRDVITELLMRKKYNSKGGTLRVSPSPPNGRVIPMFFAVRIGKRDKAADTCARE